MLTASLALPFKPVVSVNSRSPQGRKSRVTVFPKLMLPPCASCVCPAYFTPTPLPCMKPSSSFAFHSAAQASACCLSFLTSKAGPHRAPASASHACSGPCFPEKGAQPLTWYSWVPMAWMEPKHGRSGRTAMILVVASASVPRTQHSDCHIVHVQ